MTDENDNSGNSSGIRFLAVGEVWTSKDPGKHLAAASMKTFHTAMRNPYTFSAHNDPDSETYKPSAAHRRTKEGLQLTSTQNKQKCPGPKASQSLGFRAGVGLELQQRFTLALDGSSGL